MWLFLVLNNGCSLALPHETVSYVMGLQVVQVQVGWYFVYYYLVMLILVCSQCPLCFSGLSSFLFQLKARV